MFGKLIALLKGGPLNGYKTIIGYIAANVLAGNPLALEAFNRCLESPTPANIVNLIAHLLLAFGVGHQIVKKF